MSWLRIIFKVLELFGIISAKLKSSEDAVPPADKPHPPITKASVDKQVAHQRELFKKNHPKK